MVACAKKHDYTVVDITTMAALQGEYEQQIRLKFLDFTLLTDFFAKLWSSEGETVMHSCTFAQFRDCFYVDNKYSIPFLPLNPYFTASVCETMRF